MLVFGVADERQMRVENKREGAERHTGFLNADYGLIPLRIQIEIENPLSPIRDYQSVRQKSWKRSKPFLMTSMLVA